ncbi:hypothetical protein K388_07127 [Streptomyces sp. KhCrAH-43]|uniref:hypothetical protein n=1 Tax=unclassified Streptomyces TaxID=2593676 RepID=UPI000370C6E1|nr:MULTISPECIES: hypothetical protein [unclassified Streptomyces]MYS36345.1 hypothetical protein [Streptomyces sp. SID4920]MYX64000.1 hypothetical protein [Streptomyces sp. SID8373]RAJ47850.1 hypothetical protein K388_07127 [Streptomyces sp. KhCrAH-43]
MSDTTALDAAKTDIRRWTREEHSAPSQYGSRVIYTPSVLAEAAELLGKLYSAGQEHHIDREDWAAVTSLPMGVLDALAARYCSRVTLTHVEYNTVRDRLIGELDARNLTAERRQRVTVAPLPGGPSWGSSGRSGLSLGLTVGGWDISVDEIASRPHSIAAPATEDGARDVAELVRKILSGEAPNPFAAPAVTEARA